MPNLYIFLEWFCEFILILMLVGVVDGLLWFCLIDLCWGVSLRPSAQRVSLVTVGNIPLSFDLYSQMYLD